MSCWQTHRWSGWPGAWCLDCGVEDQLELCAAECALGPDLEHPDNACPVHKNDLCLEPNSGRFDPYGEKNNK